MPRQYTSAIVNAPADQVWSYVRDFGNLAEWLPGITSCELEDGASGVGAVRKADMGGIVLRERLVALSDADRSLTYEFPEASPPIHSLRATMRVAPVTATGDTFVEWWADFETDASDTELVAGILGGSYGSGLVALQKHFG